MGLTMRDVARFGPKAQRQLLEKCAAAQMAGQAQGNKYHARAERVVLPDGSVRVLTAPRKPGGSGSWTCCVGPGKFLACAVRCLLC